ncbi:MAG: hypothetical protein JO040_03830 [Gemmatimonadetes bacterium]|nr:hypothetical protein [Gemmatimonadota bacterium]
MPRTPTRLLLLGALAVGVGPAIVFASAQARGNTPPLVYRREVFRYADAGRPDPFRSLATPAELGYRIEDMQLSGVIYSPNPRLSAAILSEATSKKRFRLRVGERVGGITVAAIYPRRVDVVINEFGVIRRESLVLKRPEPVQQGEPQDRGAAPQQQAPTTPPAAQKGNGQ